MYLASTKNTGDSFVISPAYLFGQVTRQFLGFLGAIFGAHVTCGEESTRQLPWVGGGIATIPCQPTHILDHLLI